jgi:hypothetical protein
MTSDMAFECLLVSRDLGVVCAMNKVLKNFSITTNICFTSSKAADYLAGRTTDLIIVDWDDSTVGLLRSIQSSEDHQKPTILAVSAPNQTVSGVDVVLRKPVSRESCAKSLKDAYARMLRDHRRHMRYAVMTPVTAEDQNHRSVPVTVMDIGEGGIGLMTKELLALGDVLSFNLSLPDASRSIHIAARVLWTRQYGAAGCEFLRLPPVDQGILEDWIKLKCRVKQPLVEV